MHDDKCGGESNPGLCPEMDPYDGELLRSYLLNVEFKGKCVFITSCLVFIAQSDIFWMNWNY